MGWFRRPTKDEGELAMKRPMTSEEFHEAEKVKSNWRHNYTHLPPNLVKIHRNHFTTAAHILKWMHDLGCEVLHEFYLEHEGFTSFCKRLMEITSFEIQVCHDNDYIECGGPGFDDPHGHMFHVLSIFETQISFAAEDLHYITQQLRLFAERKLDINKRLKHVGMEFYFPEHKLEGDGSNFSAAYGIKLKYKLKFEISHRWGSMYNEDEPTVKDLQAAYRTDDEKQTDRIRRKLNKS